MNKSVIAIVMVMLAVGSFWGGAKYERSRIFMSRRSGGMMAFNDRQGAAQGFEMVGGVEKSRGLRLSGGLVAGEVASKDEKSIVVKLQDSGSKVVFLSLDTRIMKSADGSLDDVDVGTAVVVMGTPNQDGSLNAESIQIR
jgi:hypothetical protein